MRSDYPEPDGCQVPDNQITGRIVQGLNGAVSANDIRFFVRDN